MTITDSCFIHRFVPGAAVEGSWTLLLLHGTGGNEEDLLSLGRSLLPSAALLSPRGKVLERGLPRFFRRLSEGVFDLDDLRLRTRELAEFVGWAAGTYGFDRDRVIAVGYSNGANIAASVLMQETGTLAAAVLLHAMVPFVPETPPDLTGTPVFLSAGRTDPIVPADNVERLAAILREAGANVSLHWQSGGHQLSRDELDAARDWLVSLRPGTRSA